MTVTGGVVRDEGRDLRRRQRGRHLASDLNERGHEVTLIEQNRDITERVRKELPDAVAVIHGDACSPTCSTRPS